LIQTLNDILESDSVLRNVIIDELKQIKKQYPSPRLTQIKDEVQEITINEEAMILPEDIYVSVTKDGYIKRISQRSYKASENTAFGKKDDDALIDLHFANTLDKLLVFTDKGNYLYIPLHKLEEFKWKELGKHISYLIKISPDEKMIASLLVKSFDLPLYVMFASKLGQVKRVALKDFEVMRFSKAIKCMNLKKDDSLKTVSLTDGKQAVVLTTKNNYVTLYSEEEVSILGVKAGGIKGINLKDDELVAMNIFNPLKLSSYVFISDQPGIKRLHVSDIPSCNRATKGTLLFKSPKTNPIHALQSFILDTQDTLKLTSEEKSLDIVVKDYNFTQLGVKPSVMTAFKDQDLIDIFNPITLSTDLYDVKAIEVKEKKDNQSQEKNIEMINEDLSLKDDESLLKELNDVDRIIEPVIVKRESKKVETKKKEQNEKHFEPISFDDLFDSDDF